MSRVCRPLWRASFLAALLFLAAACALVDMPDGRSPKVPTATPPVDRYEGLNEKRDPITRVRLGRDVLVPQPMRQDVMPDVTVGPYELRGETLASALQLILDDYDISLAFEAEEGMTRKITVANLHGKLRDVVNRVCSLADLYCHFENDTITIKKTETFVVDLPPLGSSSSSSSSESGGGSKSSGGGNSSGSGGSSSDSGESSAYSQIANGLKAVIGNAPTIDTTTRVMIYTATQRSHKYALQYFERLRKNTALIIFETNIWEVTLNNENSTGIKWDALYDKLGGSSVKLGIAVPGGVSSTSSPVSLTFSTSKDAVLQFISTRGSVKTISQPQITLLSGSKASFSVSRNQNYVSGLTRSQATSGNANESVSTTTATVTTGLNMDVTSAWDESTVYGDINIALDDLLKLDTFQTNGGSVQLPQTAKRSLKTSIRVRPGDAILIGGLVSEKDNYSDSGPGFMHPLLSTSRDAAKANTELVFLLRPRVVAFVGGDDDDTPAIADAPREGVARKPAPLQDLSGFVGDLFGHSTAPKPAEPALPRPTPVAAPPAPRVPKPGEGLNP